MDPNLVDALCEAGLVLGIFLAVTLGSTLVKQVSLWVHKVRNPAPRCSSPITSSE